VTWVLTKKVFRHNSHGTHTICIFIVLTIEFRQKGAFNSALARPPLAKRSVFAILVMCLAFFSWMAKKAKTCTCEKLAHSGEIFTHVRRELEKKKEGKRKKEREREEEGERERGREEKEKRRKEEEFHLALCCQTFSHSTSVSKTCFRSNSQDLFVDTELKYEFEGCLWHQHHLLPWSLQLCHLPVL